MIGKQFNETSLPVKEVFYSNLDMWDIKGSNYKHAKRICKDFKIKNLDEYHDLYLKSDTLLLAHVFKNLKKKCF